MTRRAGVILFAAVAGATSCVGAYIERPHDAFMNRLSALCGQAFEGRVTVNEPATPNDPFEGERLVMHVRERGATDIRIPFHVGDDHSRTWVLSWSDAGARLKHDHRHEDGTPDVLTMYGGDTTDPGTAARQTFPVDAETRSLFERQGLTASLTNTWAMEIEPGRSFVYELTRPGRTFRVQFDLTRPVDLPPAPWGSSGNERVECVANQVNGVDGAN